MKKLKPVTFVKSTYSSSSQNTYQQILLLKAMSITDDPKKLRQMIGAKSVADVYRTFDKLSMRKEYHRALSKLGVDFDYIAGGIKDICDTAEKDDVRLKGYQTLLKSLGVDSYKDEDGTAQGSWEDVLLKSLEKEEKKVLDVENKDYEVKMPEIPESVKEQKRLEYEAGKSLYE